MRASVTHPSVARLLPRPTTSWLPRPHPFATVAVRTPRVGESIVDGDLVKWLVPVGAPVTRDETVLIQYSTAKATVDIMASATGRLTVQHAVNGQAVLVDHVIGEIDDAAGSIATSATIPAAAAVVASPAVVTPRPGGDGVSFAVQLLNTDSAYRCTYPLCRPDYNTYDLTKRCCGRQLAMDTCEIGQRIHDASTKFKCWPEGKISCKCPLVQSASQ